MDNIVAIVGRPNVGKSTLLNKLVGCQEAIVNDHPGVTRDRYYAAMEWAGYDFTLIDTGGYTAQAPGALEQKINQQVLIAIAEASLILFILDGTANTTAEDLALAHTLRKQGKPLLIVVNKADHTTRTFCTTDAHALGLQSPLHEVSATQGSGTGDLLDAIVKHLQPNEQQTPQEIPKVAIIGRPNVGKSTFTNALLGYEVSIVDQKPHTTRTPIHTHYRLYNKEVVLIDTAGIIKKAPPKSLAFYALVRSFRAISTAHVCIVMIHAVEGLTKQDKSILDIARRKKKAIMILVNQWDRMGEADKATYRQKLQQEAPYMGYIPILFTSGRYKKGLYQTIEKALTIYSNTRQRIPTPQLNRTLQKAVTRNAPYTAKGRLIQMNYATQLSGTSPTFAIFCNAPDQVPTNYKRYLEKHLRLASSFEGAPITLCFKKK